ncbi:unnamed protein product [Paramecium pentaurelia]|uniref:Cilia- and flagella-associated protein 45 n=1 Tax=Paramecium pentaurelia TaxID=43138 RepID=A0A8S1UU79_9CILI|nr:unnamed protein product [Paramecium pentaurelia]
MYEFWNGQDFQNRYPNNFEQQGNQFILQIISNTSLILDHFNQQQFLQALPPLSEIQVKSLFYDAKKLAESSDELQEYIQHYMDVNGNVIKLNSQFQNAEKQQCAQLLLKMIQMVQGTIGDWYKFQHQPIEIEKFEEKVDLLRHNFSIQQAQNCCDKQILKSMSKMSRPASCKSRKSEVDESLFGSNKRNDAKTAKVIQSVRKGDNSNPDVVLIGEAELQRMKNNAIVKTKEEQLYQKKLLEEQKEKQMTAAKAKKQRMTQLEEEKKKQIPLTAQQQEDKVVKDSLNARAAEILNEQLDDVKEMNKMVMYAKCVTIRDKQLQEKQQLKEEFKNQEKRKDLMMEIERLKSVKYYEEKDVQHKQELKEGHGIIVEQIKERELIRLKEKEEQEREGQIMIKQIKQVQIEDQQKNQQRKHMQKKLQDEILEANSKAIVVKEKRRLEEKEEEEKIAKYNLEKAQKEAEIIEEQKRIKEERERDVQRLREMQEKAQDRQAELDLLRAKRAMEQNERAAREKERREAELRQKLNQELYQARQVQQNEKQDKLEEQARLERDEFQRVIQKQKQERENELRLQQEKEQMVKKHAEELRKQISMNEEKRKQEERDKLEEGKKIRDKMINEKKLLENIKEQKLKGLNDNTIPDKYKAELAKKKINIQI